MAKVTDKELKAAEYFLNQQHFNAAERRFIFFVATNYIITDKEKQRFDKLVERHKFLLN